MSVRKIWAAIVPVLALALIPVSAVRADTEIPGLSRPVPVGQAQLRFLGILAYEGRLFTEGGAGFDWGVPVALELTYRRAFSASQIARATQTEMARISADAPDVAEVAERLNACFRDVDDGDRYLAVSPRPDDLRLLLNGRETCRISHPDIGRHFLSIWLSDQSRFPRLSRQLRGL